MAHNGHVLVLLIALVTSFIIITEGVTTPNPEIASLNRNSFPTGFIFGTASSAYQVHTFTK